MIGIALMASACLKLSPSPLQQIGPLLAGSALATDPTPHYRYSNVASGSGLSMGLYTAANCLSGLIPGSQQSVNADQMTAYVPVQPGASYFGVPTYGQCIPFGPVAEGSYTLTATNYYTLSIVSP